MKNDKIKFKETPIEKINVGEKIPFNDFIPDKQFKEILKDIETQTEEPIIDEVKIEKPVREEVKFEEPKKVTEYKVQVTYPHGLNVREEATMASPILRVLKYNEIVTITDEEFPPFAKLKDTEGWINTDFVKRV